LNFKLRILLIIIAAFATLAPVCVLSGGTSRTTTDTIALKEGALVEVIGENAEIRIHRAASNTLEVEATLNNAEFVDFYTQALTGEPVNHYVISATTSTGGETSANSIIDIGLPEGIELVVRTTNRPIIVDDISVISASLATTNGEISIADSTGNFDLNTTESEVTVQNVDGNVNVVTTNAHVWFEGVIKEGSSSISTTNGDISARLENGSDVLISANTHNGDVTVNGGIEDVTKDGDVATVAHRIENGIGKLTITNGPGAIHINPNTIAVFDGDS
jgi:hypothetical protein